MKIGNSINLYNDTILMYLNFNVEYLVRVLVLKNKIGY